MKMTHTNLFRAIILSIIILATIFSFVGCSTSSRSDSHIVATFSDETPTDNALIPCQLIRVVDGDTLVVLYEGEQTKVRLIGINTPESVANNESRNTEEGRIASKYVKDMLSNHTTVWLELDEDEFDDYGRLLAYVYLDDGTMLNEHMLSIGYARTAFYAPNYKYQSRLESAQKTAQKQRLGFWPTESGRDALYG